MTPKQKQSELLRCRAILLATVSYMEERLSGSFVCDQHDPIAEYYQQQKVQTEKYFQQRRLDGLQQQLASLIKGLQSRADLGFASYIKEKTGYDVDIFEGLRKRINDILVKNEIVSQRELNDVGTMLYLYNKTKAQGEDIEKLEALLANHSKRENPFANNGEGEYSEVIGSVEKDGVEEATVWFSTGPKPKHFEEQEAVSPDGKRKLRGVQWSDGKHTSTYIAVHFPTASGAVYGTTGIRPEVKAWWKNNSTIVIETKKEYEATAQNTQVRSFDDVVNIEYIEH